MGFDQETAQKALQAAHGDVSIATEFCLSGVPEGNGEMYGDDAQYYGWIFLFLFLLCFYEINKATMKVKKMMKVVSLVKMS
jgi:hypothetical protein